MVLNTQVILSLLASIAGSVGGIQQSKVISQASERISKSLVVKPSATGEFPTFQPNMPAPSVAVGAGGSGAKSVQAEQVSKKSDTSLSDQIGDMAESKKSDASLSDQIGDMAESAQTATQSADTASTEDYQGTVLDERSSDEPPNPKKRMWEERTVEPTQETRPRDEL